MDYRGIKKIPAWNLLAVVVVCVFLLSSCKVLYMFYTPSIETLQKSALKGDLEAQKQLFHEYYYGKRVPVNYQEAAKWITLAAEKNDASAIGSLAMLYENGEGVSQDLEKSYHLYYKAALMKDWIAQSGLAIFYYKGSVVKKDKVEAAAWMLISDVYSNGKQKSIEKYPWMFDENGINFMQQVRSRVNQLKSEIEKYNR